MVFVVFLYNDPAIEIMHYQIGGKVENKVDKIIIFMVAVKVNVKSIME